MKKRVAVMVILLLVAVNAQAHPPRSVALEYDKVKAELKITIAHVSSDLNEHYIRKIEVQKNQEEVISINLNRQEHPQEFSETILLDAIPEDVVSVKAFCSKGGVGTASLLIPPDEEAPAEGETDASDVSK
jgi:desulfoferrodoxin (superoxide reductase-like protein)